MKAHFKYALRSGLYLRGPVFAVIFVMNTVFIAFSAFGALPFAAHVTAISLGGTAIAVMMAFNIVSDISICRRMFAAPGAYMYALSTTPRREVLLSSVIVVTVLDVLTMTFAIIAEVVLSVSLAGGNVLKIILGSLRGLAASDWINILLFAALIAAVYILIFMIILFCVTMKKSVFYGTRAGGLLTALLAAATVYVWSLTSFLLAPFGYIVRNGMFFTVMIGRTGMAACVILLLIESSALFIVTSRLMERKLNI